MTAPTLYKVLGDNGEAHHGGHGVWHLPKGKRHGKWMDRIPDPIPCQRGYHLCRPGDLLGWLGPTIWVAEARGAVVEQADKIVVEQARLIRKVDTWNDRTARLFAADCAEQVLPIYAKHYPDDHRPAEAIRAARAFANGQASKQEMTAAWDAARAAAWAAAWDAAWDAARDAARAAAWAAARAAARAAAWDAARAAAWDAARAWQQDRLFAYLDGRIT